MISVQEALRLVTGALRPVSAEPAPLVAALGRVLAEDVAARVTQPPMAVSAMDGYAVRAADVAVPPAALRLVGEAPAGRAYAGTVKSGEAIRIFTGGPVPDGADAVVIQENTRAEGDRVVVLEPAEPGRFIRPAGLDFQRGEVRLRAGRRLTPRDIALAAAMNVPELPVRRKPRVAILATGDELAPPGGEPGPGRIISSNGPGLVAFVAAEGGEPLDLGIAADSPTALQAAARRAGGADLLVSTGGVSVGDHDLTHSALAAVGFETVFWQVAMRPGKPLLFGHLGGLPVLAMPGNPVSVLVCATVILAPAIRAMLGLEEALPSAWALLDRDVPGNDGRQDYLRASLRVDRQGNAVASPFPRQDSAMLAVLAAADCLVVRPPFAPPAKAGTRVPIIPLS